MDNKVTKYSNPVKWNILQKRSERPKKYTQWLIWYHAAHPVLWPPAVISPPPSSSSLALVSHVYFIHPDSHIRAASIIELLPSALLCNCHPTSALTFGGFVSEGGRHRHTFTHTYTKMTSLLATEKQILWYLGQRDSAEAHPIWRCTLKKGLV